MGCLARFPAILPLSLSRGFRLEGEAVIVCKDEISQNFLRFIQSNKGWWKVSELWDEFSAENPPAWVEEIGTHYPEGAATHTLFVAAVALSGASRRR